MRLAGVAGEKSREESGSGKEAGERSGDSELGDGEKFESIRGSSNLQMENESNRSPAEVGQLDRNPPYEITGQEKAIHAPQANLDDFTSVGPTYHKTPK